MRRCAVVLLLALTAACGSTPATDLREQRPAPDPATAGWSALPPGPLSARHSVLPVSVGDEVLLFGGRDTPLCPPNARCIAPERPALTDAAAYDVRKRLWRDLAPLPVAASSYEAQAVVLGDSVHLLVSHGADAGAHLRYDVGADTWERLPAPADSEVQLVAAGDVLVAYKGSQEGGRVLPDLLYNPTSRAWMPLPRDPLAPSYDRAMTWTGDRLVLTGAAVTASPGGASGPSYVRSAVLDLASDVWTRLSYQSEMISYGTDRWWDGEQVVSPYVQSFNGGQTNGYGRALPTGGRLDLDSGQWAPLPETPTPGQGRYRAASRRWITAAEGLVLDTERDQWLSLPDHDAAVDQAEAAVWAADRLVVWGGGSARIADHRTGSLLVATGAAWTPGG